MLTATLLTKGAEKPIAESPLLMTTSIILKIVLTQRSGEVTSMARNQRGVLWTATLHTDLVLTSGGLMIRLLTGLID